jgi:hypothetical protein
MNFKKGKIIVISGIFWHCCDNTFVQKIPYWPFPYLFKAAELILNPYLYYYNHICYT